LDRSASVLKLQEQWQGLIPNARAVVPVSALTGCAVLFENKNQNQRTLADSDDDDETADDETEKEKEDEEKIVNGKALVNDEALVNDNVGDNVGEKNQEGGEEEEDGGCGAVFAAVVAQLPLAPPLFHADTLTDKSERFFVSEIVREQILELFGAEIPYSCEVVTMAFKDEPKILKITAEVVVARDSQKGILIGKKGAAIKRLGSQARVGLEAFFDKKVFLTLTVKVQKNWRSSADSLKAFGYTAEK